MEQADTENQEKGKKVPRVPIKTYRWEDVRRSKIRGAYPWTYLNKPAFSESEDPENYTMEALRRTKSASTVAKTETLEITELSNGSTEDTASTEPIIDEAQTPEPPEKPQETLTVESADSSDNISQYLDKDEKDQTVMEVEVEPGPSTTTKTTEEKTTLQTNGRKERAKSEEPKRKRKHSIESSYSRISLSKIGFLKKLKNMKMPKLSLSKPNLSKTKEESPKKEPPNKKEEVKKASKLEEKVEKVEKPVYIYIPLKPPPGETDEFSHLEFEEREPTKETPAESEPKEEPVPETRSNSVQLIILTAPSDDEVLDDPSVPATPSEGDKFFDNTRIEQLKFLAKHAVNEISPKLETVAEENDKKEPSVEKESSMEKESTPIEETKMEVDQPKESKTEVEEKMIIDEEDGLKSSAPQVPEKEADQDKDKKKKKKSKEKYTKGGDDKNDPKIDSDENKTDDTKIDEIARETETKEGVPKKAENAQEESSTKETTKVEETKEESQKEDANKELSETPPKGDLKVEDTPKKGSIKKKVSFKRKSKTSEKDDDYEDIQTPKLDVTEKGETQKIKVDLLGTSQSMDEEKTYLDKKIIITTSLEEDYNKWSKISDHEYEPINPPPDDTMNVPPTLRVTDTEAVGSTLSSTTSLDRKLLGEPQEDEPPMRSDVVIQDNQPERLLSGSPETLSSRTDEVHTSQVDSSAIEKLPLKRENRKATEGPGKFQKYLRDQGGKFKTKLQGIKKPHITMPQKPKFDKLKFERPKITLPKIPDTAKISLPSFSLSRKNSAKRSLRERQFSTESNAGDSKKKIFDFSTYPRIFKKKPKGDGEVQPEFATVPRSYFKKNDEKKEPKKTKEIDRWGGRDSIRVPLHSEDSMDRDDLDLTGFEAEENDEVAEREDSVERRMASHTRFNEDIDIDDAYEKENQEIHKVSEFSSNYNPRWNHGTFHEGPTFEETNQHPNFEINTSKETHSSGSSLEPQHRRGVLEEIDSDEFFLRQKGISQDNIDVGMYLSSEIREAFKSPQNALSQMQKGDFYSREYGSEQSLPEVAPKRKQIKKPKRRKTPHVSQEAIDYDQESITEPEEYLRGETPSRPKRRSKRVKKKQKEEVIPYQETIEVEHDILKGNILSNEPYEPENVHEIVDIDISERHFDEIPAAPPRKHRSLKSLTTSEHDSIIGEINYDKELPRQSIEAYVVNHEYMIPTPEEPPPVRPARTRSHSRGTSQPDDDRTSRGAESLVSENQVPCVEEPCIKDLRDPMGYAIIDKQKVRDPPLPPRRSRSLKSNHSEQSEKKFFTVPRALNDAPPTRPLRNYSTLGPSRPPRKKQNLTDEEKENIDITQYIEIEEEPSKKLVSGEVIQKMRDRPLPAPPRPPRKKTLQDITHDNILTTSQQKIDTITTPQENPDLEKPYEETVSTQTEPLPDEFVCEEPLESTDDKVISPTIVEQNIITPTHYTHEETITHASLLVEPLNGAQILPDSQLIKGSKQTKERIIPITHDDFDEETSEIPEDFKKLKDPPKGEENIKVIERVIEKDLNTEVEVLKAQKLQVGDLDVDRLTVNELQANKITVSEIDGVNIQVSEISSKTGALKVGEIELPPNLVQELFEKLQSVANAQAQNENVEDGQKKTPFELSEEPPQRPPRQVDVQKPLPLLPLDSLHIEDICDVIEEVSQNFDVVDDPCHDSMELEETEDPNEPPQRPPRLASRSLDDDKDNLGGLIEETESGGNGLVEAPQEKIRDELEETQKGYGGASMETQKGFDGISMETEDMCERLIEEPPQRPPRHSIPSESSQEKLQEPEVDDGPPPRPPQPVYLPSQPPPSFYALRAQKYAEFLHDDIPQPPRRKRHAKPPVSRSSSEETPPAPITRRRARTPEPSIPQLTYQLVRACGNATDRSLKRLIIYVTENVLNNSDGKQDLHVIIVILLVLIAGLILLGFGDGKTVHHHHWEFFNPPRNL